MFAGTEQQSICKHHFFSRHGGVSGAPFTSLNVGRLVGDDERLVEQNRQIVKRQIGATCLMSAHQIHQDRIFTVEALCAGDREIEGYDALITNLQNCALMVQLADCQGILLHDPVKEVIAAIHNGWRGSVLNIVGKTIERMVTDYSTNPDDLRAYISPSLGPCCAEFINYQTELPHSFLPFQVQPEHFDFWQISKMQLTRSGIRGGRISVAGVCTNCSNDYYSYRRAVRQSNGITGRHSAVIWLSPTGKEI
jgi:polyphenol oxidase